MFSSPRSSPRSTPRRVASPPPPLLSSSTNTSASSASSTPSNSRSSPTGPMSPLTTELQGTRKSSREKTPLPNVSQEKTESPTGPSAWWMGGRIGTRVWFNWTSGTQLTTGQIWITKGRVESPAGLSTVGINVVSLHRVVESKNFTYIVMDCCDSDGDLSTQILHQCRYLDQDNAEFSLILGRPPVESSRRS